MRVHLRKYYVNTLYLHVHIHVYRVTSPDTGRSNYSTSFVYILFNVLFSAPLLRPKHVVGEIVCL